MGNGDREVLRSLAGHWMEWAGAPGMEERRRLWSALKELRAERPMVLFETWTLEEHVAESELECEDPLFRSIERQMHWTLWQAEEVGDDLVVEPCWRVGWDGCSGIRTEAGSLRGRQAAARTRCSDERHRSHRSQVPSALGWRRRQ